MAFTKFGSEVGAALEIDALQPIRGVLQRVGTFQERLRFSDPVLQWEVGVDAAATPAYLAIDVPDVCADARALAATRFTKLTPPGSGSCRRVDAAVGRRRATRLRCCRGCAPSPRPPSQQR